MSRDRKECPETIYGSECDIANVTATKWVRVYDPINRSGDNASEMTIEFWPNELRRKRNAWWRRAGA